MSWIERRRAEARELRWTALVIAAVVLSLLSALVGQIAVAVSR